MGESHTAPFLETNTLIEASADDDVDAATPLPSRDHGSPFALPHNDDNVGSSSDNGSSSEPPAGKPRPSLLSSSAAPIESQGLVHGSAPIT